MTTTILALEKDLFFAVKMRDTLRHYDMKVITLRSLNAFEQRLLSPTEVQPDLAIVNIATAGVDYTTVSGTVKLASGATFTEDLASIIGGSGSSLTTSGSTTLSGINSYTGATNVNAGTLALQSGGQLNGSPVTVASGATLTEDSASLQPAR